MDKKMIAPCGMNCELCMAYLGQKNNINKKGFRRTYCEGCRPRGMNCLHMANKCDKVGKGQIDFCYECDDFPCARLKALDKRYRSKYHLSMIDNLKYIKEHGMDSFLAEQSKEWTCDTCGEYICCHNGLCMNCQLEVLKDNKRYHWGDGE